MQKTTNIQTASVVANVDGEKGGGECCVSRREAWPYDYNW